MNMSLLAQYYGIRVAMWRRLPTNIRLFCIIMHVTFCLNLAV